MVFVFTMASQISKTIFLPFLFPLVLAQYILFKDLFPKNKHLFLRSFYSILCVFSVYFFLFYKNKVPYGYISVPKTSYKLSVNEKKDLNIQKDKALFFNSLFNKASSEAEEIAIINYASYYNCQSPIILNTLSEYKNNPFSETIFRHLVDASASLPQRKAKKVFKILLDFCISTNKKAFYPIIIALLFATPCFI